MYGPSSSMVDDYTAERRKTEREKRKMFPPALQHREKFCMRKKNFSLCVCVCVFVTCFNRFEGVGGGGNDPWLCTDDLPLG